MRLKVFIVLLNWNGWENTIQCLESLFRSNYKDFRVIVCDNLSTDGSMDKIKAWAEGNSPIQIEGINESLKHLVFPPVKKPLGYVEYYREEAEYGGKTGDENVPLVLIHNGANNGFSAGNNVGIRYAMKKNADYIWLLNNDTLVAADTLNESVNLMLSDDRIGIAGSVIFTTDVPFRIQTYGGGKIIRFLGMDRFVHSPGPIDYVCGTSLFTKREVIEQTGLLDESFFFYWEDTDFSRRAVKKGWKLAVAPQAVVFHKFSASVGAQSLKSDLYKVGSLIYFYRKHFKFVWIFPVSIHITGMIFNRLIRRQFSRILPIIKETFKAAFKRKAPLPLEKGMG
jgi:GT2 family glycosyltransferase